MFFVVRKKITFLTLLITGLTCFSQQKSTGNVTLSTNMTVNLTLDNTSQKSRSLNSYYLQDVRLSFLLENKIFKATNFIVQLNNVFNKKYEPNGYSFSYIYGGALTTENFYFPMAGFNFMVGVNVKF